MANEMAEYQLPSNPADRKKIVDAVSEIAATMTEIKDKRSYITDTKKRMKEELSVPPKILTKMAKALNEAKFEEMVAENEAFRDMYEVLFEGGSST
jgi:hypothetical protein